MVTTKIKTSSVLFQKIPFDVLIFLWYNQKTLQKPINQQKLSRNIDVTVSALSRILLAFEKVGIISRIPKGRENLIIVTDEGMNVGDKVCEISNKLVERK